MKITIEHLGVKRQIEGSGFNICGSKDDLLAIAEQLLKQVQPEFCYGWIKVRDEAPDEHFAGPNSPALPWSEELASLEPTNAKPSR